MIECGSYTLHQLETGTFKLDGGAMFGIVPKPLWSERIPADSQNRIELAMRCLLIQGEGRCLLVDTGIGTTFSEKEQSIFAIDHSTHTLEESLSDVGVAPSDVTDVVFTHLHFDHCGGAVVRHGDAIVPRFPKATHHVQAEHWKAARNPNPKEQNSFRAAILDPLADRVAWTFHEGAGVLMPGIDLLRVDGHTTAQQMVKVSSPEATYVFVADLLPTHHHAGAAWTMAYDIAPLQTIDEKAGFLHDAEAGGWTLLLEHDPEVAHGRVQTSDRGQHIVVPNGSL
jgi:glyoxylase-like metal-dependent hydrolase (beta-lactamase superfamily II)